MITDKELEHLAALARIKISEKEKEGLQKDLSSILNYIETLNEVGVINTEPLFQVTGIVNSWREDTNRGEFKMDEVLNEKLIGQAPDKKDRLIKVKSVLNRSKK